MPETRLADRIRDQVAAAWITPARRRGAPTARVAVADVEHRLGLRQRAPAICSALRSQKFLREQRLELVATEGPASGQSPRVVYTYRLQPLEASGKVTDWFGPLHGMLRGMFDTEGGAEAFLRGERARFRRVNGSK